MFLTCALGSRASSQTRAHDSFVYHQVQSGGRDILQYLGYHLDVFTRNSQLLELAARLFLSSFTTTSESTTRGHGKVR